MLVSLARSRAAWLAALLLAVLPGCDAFDPEFAGVQVRFVERSPLVRELLVVTMSADGTDWLLEGTDLTPGADGWLESREIRLPTGTRALVRVAVRGDGAEPAAVAQLELPLEADDRWRLDVLPSAEPPEQVCGGCTFFARVPIEPGTRPSAQDWLYLTLTALPVSLEAR